MFYSLFFVLLCLSGLSFAFSAISPIADAGAEIKAALVIVMIPVSHFAARFFDHLIGNTKAVEDSGDDEAQSDEAIRFLFIKTLFVSLGRVANADNKVCDNELEFAEQVTVRLKLCADYADMAVESFQAGIYNHGDFDQDLQKFAKTTSRKPGLQQIMFEILLDMASKSGTFTRAEFLLLEKIRNALGNSRYLDELLDSAKPEVEDWQDSDNSEQQSDQQTDQQSSQQQSQAARNDKKTRQAFKLLGLKPTAEVSEIKRRYRQLMKMHHPDRLIAQGLPEDLIDQATERAAKINKAYKHLRIALKFN